ncbi:ribosome biogenesis protein Nop53/GLTSCR2 [Naematelia encephala]|uniref:Ribosome biogenesis protein NOP53 n=1 Tax=Naematelia encephala TaxID=71784 RepID=A0A1Y2AV93_9TREE|nr:ribosome biogenesis protein Nop53/GLTSCR2 [Naematelia encephala]
MPSSSTTTTSKTSAPKPYNRPLPASIGAPSQIGQSSRKGKKAWRKNIDITREEAALELGREEERATGGKVAQKKDTELFTIDTVGDVDVAKKLRRAPKPLRSLAVLSERSAVPSITSRPVPSSSLSSGPSKRLSAAEKARLRRIARRSDEATSSADMKALPITSLRDAWTAEAEPQVIPPGAFGEETIVKRIVKPPRTLAQQREIRAVQIELGRGVEIPEGGVSYNPTAESHGRLLELAVEEEKARLQKEAEEERKIALLAGSVDARKQHVDGEDFAEGMRVGPGYTEGEEEEEGEEEGDSVVKQTKTKRKTQAQRNKALRQRELARLEALEKEQRRLARSVETLSLASIQGTLAKRDRRAKEAERLAKLAKRERERLGLAGGEKIGKHRVKKADVTVQLGEDLAESLRQVKPEGNLFKDRFVALQKRALVEPRERQLPTKRVRKVKEYEKHAYKRFV